MDSSTTAWHKRFFLPVLVVLAFAASLFAIDVKSIPQPTGYVSDLAHVLDDTAKNNLEEFCTKVEQQLGVQLALVTVDTLGDQPIRDFALDLSRKWGVGDRKSNQGVLLLLAVKDRKSDIETGRGIEPYLTDGFSGSTLRSMRPDLRAGNYGAALQTAAHEMASQIAQGKNIPFSDDQLPTRNTRPRNAPGDDRGGFPCSWIVIGFFFILWLFSRGRRGGGGRGGMRGGGGGGFWPGVVIGSMLNSGGRRSGSDWGSGGGFGGDSGGGGGFGGFGGGDFGGGGASSDW